MSGISDKAINKLSNQNKFNGGVELEEDYGVNLYSTFYRQYDPQLGRFSGVDILSEGTAELSPYHFCGNNPIIFNDPTGAKFIDNNGNNWHHTDGLAGTLAEGTAYDPGMGWWSGGGSNGGGGGGYGVDGESHAIEGGFSFSGSFARSLFRSYVNAFNHPDADGNWSFSVGQNKNGDVGYWESFFMPGDEATDRFLAEEKCISRFVSANGSVNQKERPDLGFVGNRITNQAGSEFGKDLFENYWQSGGTLNLSQARFNSIVKAAGAVQGNPTPATLLNGQLVIAKVHDFYNSSEYALALGRATIYYDQSGNPVGFSDTYDFDPKPWGVRSYTNEVKTRSVNAAGSVHGATAFDIYYGLHQ